MADTTTPAVATPDEVAAFRTEQEKEWNTYIAVADITYNGARAYNAGDPVPASNVERHGYLTDKLVARIGTKAADETVTAVASTGTAAPLVNAGNPVSLNVSVPTGK